MFLVPLKVKGREKGKERGREKGEKELHVL